mgnify:CR=1 FL=1
MKPTNTELMAARMSFDLKYDSTPNWETYDLFLRMFATDTSLYGRLDSFDDPLGGATSFVTVLSILLIGAFIYMLVGSIRSRRSTRR